jgi:hypothetical protein
MLVGECGRDQHAHRPKVIQQMPGCSGIVTIAGAAR